MPDLNQSLTTTDSREPDNDVLPPALLARIPSDVIDPPTRWTRAEYIAGLDPERHCQEIGFLLASFEFPCLRREVRREGREGVFPFDK